ncbi:SAM-dependent methyltransferase [Arthrobacter alpinus]|uniref:SAM-dependent methyltransferase n=1 Tax=Arthrobacter alpinus TaxID=656366 RepID=A0A0M3UG73_9MICC|nr:class I SAM-dependent methyltransferase [Arthrobacter alpinus]ALE92259.1 SAM-dependent methyltransferase [Arthrobacter alpinus]
MDSENLWEAKKRNNPGHSAWFIARFAGVRAEGLDLDGEARLADALASRSSRILDAGCGTGRVGGELARRGHRVVGVDLDAELIEAARLDYPDVDWRLGDLSTLSLPGEEFELIVCAGNVLPFLAPGTAASVLTGFRDHLAPGGRVIGGFGAGRGYDFADFFGDVERSGLTVAGRFATWQLHPLTPESDFVVALLELPAASA